ncbi:MAG: asparagine synthase (glutamine-hydrolyzing) [Betaproteobacteria bacterium]|nr:asparagine synthase (glutamine-hydrolyzing) [Betaproteobacteria bacterium]
MCGITGYWAQKCQPEAWSCDLAGSVQSLLQRGPDDSGTWLRAGGSVAFGHTRLSILDLSSLGHQPMVSEDSDFVMAFNGEIYNFAEIKAQLEKCGHRFRSSGDSEVVLAALRQWGIAAVERFIGMFAIALWRESERRLWLIRDRLGIKPLYYAWDGRSLWFGSELKALRAFGAWRAEIDPDALGEYFQFGYISAPRSIYRRVFKLLPGHWLELREGGEPVTRCYWSALEPREPLAGSEHELEEQLEAMFIDAFRYRMIADVPVGIFLSGGLDSSLVAAILARHSGQTVHTFTIGFTDPNYDESRWARRVADYVGSRHTERILSPREMAGILTRWGDLFDEPFGDASGVPTFLVSRVARESAKVALSADGGDELFSGYGHYGAMLTRQRILAQIPRPVRHTLSHSLQSLPGTSLQRLVDRLPAPASLRHTVRRAAIDRLERLRSVLPEVCPATLYDLGMSFWTPAECAQLLGGSVSPRPVLNGHTRCFADYMSCSDLRFYLPDDILTKVDRTTMAVGLEGREPLLDHRLVEFALRLPLRLRRGSLGAKHLLRRVLYRYIPRSILERPKHGFAVPMSRWLRGELSELLDTYLAPDRVQAAGILNPEAVQRALICLKEGGLRRDRLDVQKVWLLAAFEMWRERWAVNT